MIKQLLPKAAIALLLLSSVTATAGEKEEAILAKMVKAYGGDALTTARGLTIIDKYKGFFTGQGQSAGFTEVTKTNVELTIDYAGQRKSLTEWLKRDRGNWLSQTIVDGTESRRYDLYSGNYDTMQHLTYATLGAGIERAHDTALARMAWDQRDRIKYTGEAMLRAAPHDTLTIQMDTGPALTLFIDRETGLISKAARTHPYVGEQVYVFSNYKQNDNVTYAADLQYSLNGEPELISVARSIEVNPPLDTAFAAPSGFAPRGETIDTAHMNVQTLADGVYYAGQGYAFSIFIDAGDYFIGAGGNPGLGHRFQALKAHTGTDKPLKYQVVTHHHGDHIAGMQDAANLGAHFYVVPEHITSVQAVLDTEVPAGTFIPVRGKASIADGAVELYELESSHADQNLLVYIPSAKLMFTADHFSSDLKTNLPTADKGTVFLRDAISAWQLDVERFVGAHAPRILTRADLQTVADSYREEQCPPGVRVCME